MPESILNPAQPEMEVVDLRGDPEFQARQSRPRDIARAMDGMQRLAHVFAQFPSNILQELVDVSVDMCRAESAGITLEEMGPGGEAQFRWIATAGKYAGFLGAVLPRSFSPCGTCLDRGGPQMFRVSKSFLDMIGVDAPEVTDGLLIPWEVDGVRGTIWVVAHGPRSLFDGEDYNLLRSLADMAAAGVRQQRMQADQIRQMAAESAAAMANELAHKINNPLQSLMQTIYLAEMGGIETDRMVKLAAADLDRLAGLVKQLLDLPGTTAP
jgi:hypothetical protein